MSKPTCTNSPTSSSVWVFACWRVGRWKLRGIARNDRYTANRYRNESFPLPWSLFSETYCGGYSGEDPPLPIPNREVKLTIADGTAPPGGRVGSCHFLIRHPVINRWRGVLLYTRVPDEDSSWSSWELTTPFILGQAGEDSSSIINTCSSSCLYLDTMS